MSIPIEKQIDMQVRYSEHGTSSYFISIDQKEKIKACSRNKKMIDFQDVTGCDHILNLEKILCIDFYQRKY